MMPAMRAGMITTVTAAIVCCAACRTSQVSTHPAAPSAAQPGLMPEQMGELKRAVGIVFRDHGFIEVPTAVHATDGVTWFITARTQSPGGLTMATVKVTPQGELAVSLSAYQRVGCDWAALGRFFRGPINEETAVMKREIQDQLDAIASSDPLPH